MNDHDPTTNEEHTPPHDIQYDAERDSEPHVVRPAPRIWIGSLADYNAGRLHGAWIDAATDSDTLHGAARGVLATSTEPTPEEWGIFDHEDFAPWRPSEHEDLDVVAAVARGIAEHGPAFAAWAYLCGTDPEQLSQFDDAYRGHFDSATDWAEHQLDETGAQSELDRVATEHFGKTLASYAQFDIEGLAHDAWLGGDISVVHDPDGGVWIFDGHV